MVARKLVAHGGGGNDLDTIVRCLTSAIAHAPDHEARLRILIEEWAFSAALGTAILNVFYPDSFTVYDVRVCNELQNHHNVQNKTRFKDLWDCYQLYLNGVRNEEPRVFGLRDKDRALWARSFERQLKDDISRQFRKGVE